MRRIVTPVLVAGLLLGAANRVRAQEDARAMVVRAVQAHGGEANLAKIRADLVKIKGSLTYKGEKVPFVAETLVQLPGQFKNTMTFHFPNNESTLVQVLNGDKAWISVNGKTQLADDKLLAELQQMMHMDRVVRLLPLLGDKNFQLTPLGESKVEDNPVVGVEVAAKGQKNIRLYFDKASGLLIATTHTVPDDNGKTVPQEERYSDFKVLNGFKRPTRVVAYRGGEKFMEGELTDVKEFDKVPDSEFVRP